MLWGDAEAGAEVMKNGRFEVLALRKDTVGTDVDLRDLRNRAERLERMEKSNAKVKPPVRARSMQAVPDPH
jgi:hypothetical protein